MNRVALVALIFLLVPNSLPAQPTGSSREDFLKLANYLVGEWFTPSPSYDAKNPLSSKGFGLWFTLELNKNLLHLTHAVFRGDTAHITGQSYWLWHPGDQRIKYYSIGSHGGFTEGETYFTSDDQFVTTEYSYSANGRIKKSRDENTMISADEHSTTTSDFEKGAWKQTGTYPFRKSDAKKYYKVIEYH